MRTINNEGLDLIKQWEGKFLTAYHGAADRPGLLTIGYGHTDAAGPPKVTAGMKIGEAEAVRILRRDLGKCEESVERLVKVPLNDNQFSALVSFTFNCGAAALGGSSLLRKLNAGDYESVPAELMKWTRANGKPVQGLVNRRAAEAGLWAKGAFVASQYVEPEQQKETMLSALAKPDALVTVASGTVGAMASGGGIGGPIGWAIAIAIVVAVGIAAFYFVRRIQEQGT